MGGFGEKSGFSPNFCPYGDVEAMGQKIDPIPFWLNLTSFHLKTMIPLFLCNSASNF